MMERKDTSGQKFKSPGICYYHPSYTSIEPKSSTVIPFKIIKKTNSPRYRIQKLWKSYKVTTDYSLVEFSKQVSKVSVNA